MTEHVFCTRIYYARSHRNVAQPTAQLHSNQGDIETSVTWKAGPVRYTGETVSDFISVPQYVIVV